VELGACGVRGVACWGWSAYDLIRCILNIIGFDTMGKDALHNREGGSSIIEVSKSKCYRRFIV
jgi:hypothetical protein